MGTRGLRGPLRTRRHALDPQIFHTDQAVVLGQPIRDPVDVVQGTTPDSPLPPRQLPLRFLPVLGPFLLPGNGSGQPAQSPSFSCLYLPKRVTLSARLGRRLSHPQIQPQRSPSIGFRVFHFFEEGDRGVPVA